MYWLGFHRTIHRHWPGPCRNVNPIESGAEAIALSSQGLAFMSSGYKTPDATDERIQRAVGRIYLFDFNKSDDGAKELIIKGDITLEIPHGISLWEDAEGIQIQLVHHRSAEDTVEIFRFHPPEVLLHVKTIRSPLFVDLNDVVATSNSSFYVTNMASLRPGILQTISFLLQVPTASVVYYDEDDAKLVVRNCNILNGITRSSDGKFLFVSYMFDEAVAVFQREQDGSLTRSETISLSAVPDNLFYDTDNGDLLVSCGIPIGFLRMITDYDHRAPSHLLRIRPLGGPRDPFRSYDVVEIFADDGKLLSMSSSSAKYNNRLLLGSVLHKAALCDLRYVIDQ